MLLLTYAYNSFGCVQRFFSFTLIYARSVVIQYVFYAPTKRVKEKFQLIVSSTYEQIYWLKVINLQKIINLYFIENVCVCKIVYHKWFLYKNINRILQCRDRLHKVFFSWVNWVLGEGFYTFFHNFKIRVLLPVKLEQKVKLN